MPIPATMRAMVLESPGTPLQLRRLPVPQPGPNQLLLKVQACGVCRTDLHILDGELEHPALPLIPGHQIVAKVAAVGGAVSGITPGARVGIPWLGGTCGTCRLCRSGRENLCPEARFTGYSGDGGFAEYALADPRYAFPLPADYGAVEAAPLLCAGLIGYRSYRLAGAGIEQLGIYGFGAAAHIVTQIAVHQGQQVYAFTRPGDTAAQQFARSLGAIWAGDCDQLPPVPLDAALIFAPAGELVPAALAATAPGGSVVCGGIHMSDIPAFPYKLLWEERSLRSVANLTRRDGLELLELAPRVPVRTVVTPYPLEEANRALTDLRQGALEGAAVLVMED